MYAQEWLDSELVHRLIQERGLKKTWVREQLGLKKTTGSQMLGPRGTLPADPEVRSQALQALARLVGCSVSRLLIRKDKQKKTA